MRKLLTSLAVLSTVAFVASAASPAYAAPVADEFTVESLTLDEYVAVDTISCTGDDGGLVAISGDNVLLGGDSEGCDYALPDLTVGGPIPGLTSHQVESLFSDLSTERAYFLEFDTSVWPRAYSGIVPINDDLTLGAELPLSESVTVTNECLMIASGWKRVVLWDGCAGEVHDIEIATGSVTKLTGQATFAEFTSAFSVTPTFTKSEAFFTDVWSGVAEFTDGTIRILSPPCASGWGETPALLTFALHGARTDQY